MLQEAVKTNFQCIRVVVFYCLSNSYWLIGELSLQTFQTCVALYVIQSINAEFVGRRYTTRPGAPAESVKSTIKKYIRESFSKCTGISNIMKVGWKSVPSGWTGAEEATFIKSCSCSWQNVGL